VVIEQMLGPVGPSINCPCVHPLRAAFANAARFRDH
jgi:hypothetical protein